MVPFESTAIARGIFVYTPTNQIFRSENFFGYFGQNFGIRGAEHDKRTELTQPSPTSFPVIQWQCTLCDKCCCILPGIYTALRFQQPLPTSLAPCLTCTISSQTFLHTSCKFWEFPRYFVHPTVCFACRMRYYFRLEYSPINPNRRLVGRTMQKIRRGTPCTILGTRLFRKL